MVLAFKIDGKIYTPEDVGNRNDLAARGACWRASRALVTQGEIAKRVMADILASERKRYDRNIKRHVNLK